MTCLTKCHKEKMSILGQGIPYNGQPTFPSKDSAGQDLSQFLPIMTSPQHSNSLESNRISSLLSNGVSANGESAWKSTVPFYSSDIFTQSCSLSNQKNAYETEGITRFFRSAVENEKINVMKCNMEQLGLFSTKPDETLFVDVSSAVKLEGKQMDQIAKKMKRVTGFRKVELENIIDPSLIAGFVVRYEKEGSHIIDLSVKGQLANLAVQIESMDQKVSWAYL